MAEISRDRNSSVSGTERVCGSGKGVEGLLEQSKTTGNVKKRPMFLLLHPEDQCEDCCSESDDSDDYEHDFVKSHIE